MLTKINLSKIKLYLVAGLAIATTFLYALLQTEKMKRAREKAKAERLGREAERLGVEAGRAGIEKENETIKDNKPADKGRFTQ